MDSENDFFTRIPFLSVTGLILVLVGSGVVAGTLFKALLETEIIFSRDLFKSSWLLYLRVAALVASCLVAMIAVLIFIFSCFATNATRDCIFGARRTLFGGRYSSSLLITVVYSTQFFWLLVLIFLTAPSVCWWTFSEICSRELTDLWHGPGVRRPGLHSDDLPMWSSHSYHEGYHRRDYLDDTLSEHTPTPNTFNITACGVQFKSNNQKEIQISSEFRFEKNKFARFCAGVFMVGPLYICAVGGALFILVGLSLFVSALSTYHVKLKLTKKMAEYKQSLGLKKFQDASGDC